MGKTVETNGYFLIAGFVKLKSVIIAAVIGFIAAGTDYIRKRRDGLKPTIWGVVWSILMSVAVAFTVLAIFQFFGWERFELVAYALMFWFGQHFELVWKWFARAVPKLLNKWGGNIDVEVTDEEMKK